MKYSFKEKQKHLSELRSADAASADLELLIARNPQHPNIKQYARNPKRYADDILYTLLEFALRDEIRNNRRKDIEEPNAANLNPEEPAIPPENPNAAPLGSGDATPPPTTEDLEQKIKELSDELHARQQEMEVAKEKVDETETDKGETEEHIPEDLEKKVTELSEELKETKEELEALKEEAEEIVEEAETAKEEAEERAELAEAELEEEKKKIEPTEKPKGEKSKSTKNTSKSTGTTSPIRKSKSQPSSTTTE